MGTRGDKAKEYFLKGYNCSQAVVLAFSDKTGLNEKQASALVSGFGGGMGRMREVCGAVSGMVTVLNLLYGYSDPKDNEAKKEHYQRVQLVANKFKEQNNSIVCRELLGLDQKGASVPTPDKRTDEYYKKRPCVELVSMAADILNDYINEQNK